jgi:hypothetical protein
VDFLPVRWCRSLNSGKDNQRFSPVTLVDIVRGVHRMIPTSLFAWRTQAEDCGGFRKGNAREPPQMNAEER